MLRHFILLFLFLSIVINSFGQGVQKNRYTMVKERPFNFGVETFFVLVPQVSQKGWGYNDVIDTKPAWGIGVNGIAQYNLTVKWSFATGLGLNSAYTDYTIKEISKASNIFHKRNDYIGVNVPFYVQFTKPQLFSLSSDFFFKIGVRRDVYWEVRSSTAQVIMDVEQPPVYSKGKFGGFGAFLNQFFTDKYYLTRVTPAAAIGTSIIHPKKGIILISVNSYYNRIIQDLDITDGYYFGINLGYIY